MGSDKSVTMRKFMNERRLLTAMSFVLIGMSAFAQVQVDPRFIDLNERLEKKVSQIASGFLGNQTQFIVSVDVESVENAEALGSGGAGPQTDWIALEYASPGSSPLSSNTGNANLNMLPIQGVNILIQVSQNLGTERIDALQNLIKTSFTSLNPNVKVEAKLNPPPTLETLATKYGSGSAVLGALIITIGMLGLGVLFAKALGNVTEGIKSIRPQIGMKDDSELSIKLPEMPQGGVGAGLGALGGVPDSPKPVGLPSASYREQQRNLRTIGHYLAESPLLIAKSIGGTTLDLQGVRYLITQLPPPQQLVMKNILGPERLLKAQGAPDASQDLGGWLQGLVEKLEVKKLVGNSSIEEQLDSEVALKLCGADTDSMVKACMNFNDPAVWRVAMEFIPADSIRAKLKQADFAVWDQVFKASSSENLNLKTGARRLLDAVEKDGLSQGSAKSSFAQSNMEIVRDKLLPAAIDNLINKDLGEDDAFLSQLEAQNPELVKEVRKHFWTPSTLNQINDDDLKFAMDRMGKDQKIAVIASMPEDSSQRLMRLIPDGMGKRIITDTVARMRQDTDKNKIKAYKPVAREFLDYLRKQVEAGNITLNGGGSNEFSGSEPVSVIRNAA